MLRHCARLSGLIMPARESEALILRTYPYREADLIVSFFAREQGKLRGLAKGVRRPKSRFGSGLERLSHVRLFYFQRENQELAKLDRCELLGPPIFLRADYATGVALDFLAEVSEQLLPEHEPNDAFFRLLLVVLNEMWTGLSENSRGGGELPPGNSRGAAISAVEKATAAGPLGVGSGSARQAIPAGILPASAAPQGRQPAAVPAGSGVAEAPGWLWRAVTYFALWAVRLGGWLPPLSACIHSGAELDPKEKAYFERSHPGLFSASFRTPNSWPLSAESRAIANEMLKKSLPQLSKRLWNRQTAEDLRRFMTQRLEAQFETRLKTAAALAEL